MDKLIDLQAAMKGTRARLQKQLSDCESGLFRLFRMDDGKKIDTTSDHIAEIKRQIAEYDRLIVHFSER